MARTLPDSRTLGLAFLGCGGITRRHARLIGKAWPEVARFYASRDAAKAEACLSELNGVAAFGSYREAIEDERVDAVVVATPTVSHLELTLAALAAGKDVIVEKPPFMRSADFDRVEEAERTSGRRVFVGENYFYRPLVRRLREIITRGDIGEVRYLLVKALKEQTTGGWRDDAAIAGGGALFEGGIHWVNLMGALGLTIVDARGYMPGAGERESGKAGISSGAPALPPSRSPAATIERSMLAVFRYAEGAVGTLFHAWDTPSLLKGLRLSRIYGTGGSIAFESNGLFLLVFGKRPRIIFPGFRDISGYRAMFADYLHCIRTGAEPEMTLARARRDLELVEAAYRTSQETA